MKEKISLLSLLSDFRHEIWLGGYPEMVRKIDEIIGAFTEFERVAHPGDPTPKERRHSILMGSLSRVVGGLRELGDELFVESMVQLMLAESDGTKSESELRAQLLSDINSLIGEEKEFMLDSTMNHLDSLPEFKQAATHAPKKTSAQAAIKRAAKYLSVDPFKPGSAYLAELEKSDIPKYTKLLVAATFVDNLYEKMSQVAAELSQIIRGDIPRRFR